MGKENNESKWGSKWDILTGIAYGIGSIVLILALGWGALKIIDGLEGKSIETIWQTFNNWASIQPLYLQVAIGVSIAGVVLYLLSVIFTLIITFVFEK